MDHRLTFDPSSLQFHRPFTPCELKITNSSRTSFILYRLFIVSMGKAKYRLGKGEAVICLEPEQAMTLAISEQSTSREAEGKFRQDTILVESVAVQSRPFPEEDPEQFWSRITTTIALYVASWTVPIMILPPPGEPLNGIDLNSSKGEPHRGVSPSIRSDTNEIDSSPLREGEWVRLEPLTETYSDIHIRHLYNRPTNSSHRSAIHQCRIKYDNGELEAARVVVKQLKDPYGAVGGGDGRSTVRRAENELRVWAALRHPNIAPLLGYSLHPRICFAMPYYVNGTVFDFVRQPDVSNQDKLDLIRDIAAALHHMHTEGFIHGDLKHDNVLVDQDRHAFLIDFGLSMTLKEAKRTTNRAGNERYTWIGLARDGLKSCDTDIYAFGLLVLEIATGELAFRRQTGATVDVSMDSLPKTFEYPELKQTSPLWSLMTKCWQRQVKMAHVWDILRQITRSDFGPY